MDNGHILEETKQLYAAVATDLAQSRRPLLAQRLHFPKTDTGRRLADRVLRLAKLQTLSGRLDHARSDRILDCYRELRKRLNSPVQLPSGKDFLRAHHETAQIRALDSAVGFHLAALMALTALQIEDDSKYSQMWSALLLALQPHLLDLASAASGEQIRVSDGSKPPPAFFPDKPFETQAQQIRWMEQSDRYHILPRDPDSGVRFVLTQLALIVLWADGTRRDIDLALLVQDEPELPRVDVSPRIVSVDEEPMVEYIDRCGRRRVISYNNAAMRYRMQTPEAKPDDRKRSLVNRHAALICIQWFIRLASGLRSRLLKRIRPKRDD